MPITYCRIIPGSAHNHLLIFLLALLFQTASTLLAPKPIDPSGWPDRFPAQDHCSRCGLCETTFVSKVQDACAFLGEGMGRIDSFEANVHGRSRHYLLSGDDNDNDNDEARFGVLQQPIRLAKGKGMTPEAQWTGVVTSIAYSMLEAKEVDAVVCIASSQQQQESDDGWCNPQPILARTTEQVLQGRGVKPALAPSLAVLDEIQADSSLRKLLFCGVGCAVQAFRSIQDSLDLDEIYVLGTNCVDNSPTPQAAQRFLQEGLGVEEGAARGYEFMQDFQVHVKTDSQYIKKPYFSLPGTIAAPSIATSCKACFDYTNGLADVVVGYMGAPLDDRMDQSYNTLTIRNERGSKMVETAWNANRLELGDVATGSGSHETLALSTVKADSIVLDMVGGKVPEKGMPIWLGRVLAGVISNFVSPKGLNFAKYSIDYHILRNYLHARKEWGEERAQRTMPQAARDIVQMYMADEKDATMRELVAQMEALKVQEKR